MHQAGLVGELSKDVSRLRAGQRDAEEKLEEICNIAEGQRVRDWEMCMVYFTLVRHVSASVCLCHVSVHVSMFWVGFCYWFAFL